MGIVRLPGTKLTAKVLLAQILEDSDELESVVIIGKWKNEATEVAWSRQDPQEVALAIQYLEMKLHQILSDAPTDNEVEDAS